MTSVPRVLHVIDGLEIRRGGPIVAMVGLAAAQSSAGLSVRVLALQSATGESTLADRLTAGGVDVRLIAPPRRPFFPGKTFLADVESVLEGINFIHLHGVWEEILHVAATTAMRLKLPYVVTPHGMLDPWALEQKWLKKWVYRKLRLDADLSHAAAVHFAADRERDQSLAAMPGRWKQSIVEPFGIDRAEFEPLPELGRFRDRYPELTGKKIIAFLGRLHPGKGVEYLLPAMALAKSDQAVLVVAGPDSGTFGDDLRAMAKRLNVDGRVLFTGILRGEHRVELLRDADLFALPSEHENFGVVVAEALAAGCPAVVSDEVNLCSTVEAMNAGAVVAMKPAETLAERLAATLDEALSQSPDPAERERIRSVALTTFDWGKIGTSWFDLYQSLVQRSA